VGVCAVPKCGREIAPHLLMCRWHWFAVPKPLRDEVWRTYREEGVTSENYWEARDAAIGSVSDG
jgi:hypothetical protein